MIILLKIQNQEIQNQEIRNQEIQNLKKRKVMSKNMNKRDKRVLRISVVIMILIFICFSGVVIKNTGNEQSDSSSFEVVTEEEVTEEVVTETTTEKTKTTESETTGSETTESQTKQSTTESEPEDYTFKNNYRLEDHYEKHGKDMGFKDAESYEDAASKVVNNPEALHKTEEEDGDDVYYVEKTNEFVVVSPDGYIRTYFNPDDGINYYNRQ